MARNKFVTPGGTRLSPAAKRLIGGKNQRIRIFKQYAFPVNMAIDGIEDQKQYVDNMRDYIINDGATTLLKAAVQGTGDVLQRSFATQGRYGGVKWPPITEGTKKQREKLGYPPDAPPLVRSGALQKAISEFVLAYGKSSMNSVNINESFTGVVHPANRTRRKTGKDTGDMDKDTVTVNVKQVSSGKTVRRAELKISGDSVANQFGYSTRVWSPAAKKYKTVKVPARPFWFVNARTTARARTFVKNAINGIEKNTLAEMAPKKYALGVRGYWRNRAQQQFDAQRMLKLPGNATPKQRIELINKLIEEKMSRHGGSDLSARMWRAKAQREIAENPWYWTDMTGEMTMGGIVASLRHASGPRMSQVYKIGSRTTGGKTPRGLSPRDRWRTVELPSGKIYIQYKYKAPGEKGAAKFREVDITTLAGVKQYLAHSQESGAVFQDYDVYVGRRARQLLQGVKTEKQAQKAAFDVLIRTIEVESAARGGTFEGQRISSSRYRRKVIAQSFRSDVRAEGLLKAMTATEVDEKALSRTERIAGAVRFGVTAGRKPGVRETTPTEVAIRLRGEIKRRREAFYHTHGKTFEDVIAGLSTERTIVIQDPRDSKKSFKVSEAELALFAPEGRAVVSSKTGLFTLSTGQPSQWALRQNLVNQSLSSDVILPEERGVVERVLQDYLAHGTGEHVRTGKGAYASLVDEKGAISRPGKKAATAYIDQAVWSNIQREAMLIRIKDRTLKMLEERINAAWAEGLMQDRDEQVRRYLGIRENTQALQINPGRDLLQEALNFIREDELRIEKELRAQYGYPVYLPRYGSRWRQRGWGVDYSSMDSVLSFETRLGYKLTDRPLTPQPGRAYTETLEGQAQRKGQAGARTSEIVEDNPFQTTQIRSVNRKVAMWVNREGRVGLTRAQAVEIGLLQKGIASPEFEAFRDIQKMWEITVEGNLIRHADAKLRVNAEDIYRDTAGVWWIRGTKRGESAGWAGYLRGNRGKIAVDYATGEQNVARIDPFVTWMAQPINNGEGDMYILDPQKSVFGKEIQKRAESMMRREYYEAIVELQQQHPEIFRNLKPGEFQDIIGYRQAQYYARTLVSQRKTIEDLKARRSRLTRLERYALTHAERKAREAERNRIAALEKKQ